MAKLKPAEINYLSFEGGGGKGPAYLGAFNAFKRKEIGLFKEIKRPSGIQDWVLDKSKIKGLAGASAGAITSVLLACGYTYLEIKDVITNSKILNSFYDDPKVGSYIKVNSKDREYTGPGRFSYSSSKIDKLKIALLKEVFSLILRAKAKDLPTAAKKFLKSPDKYFDSLYLDKGFFTGENALKFIDNKINANIPIDFALPDSDRVKRVTFQDFKKIFQIDLVLTGTNLVDGKSKYFSAENTPDFFVSDAARISMSIPFFFKPIFIYHGDFEHDNYNGAWVDGGVLNNNPIHAFDAKDGTFNPNMLGIRLEKDLVNDTIFFDDMAGALVSAYMNSSELGQIRSPQEQLQTVNLRVGKLSTFEFSATPEDLQKALELSEYDVLEYFGLEDMVRKQEDFPPVWFKELTK